MQDQKKKIRKNGIFDNVCNFAAFWQYFTCTVLWKVIVRKTWFVSSLHQNYLCSSSFGGRRGIHGEFGKSLQFFDFFSNFVSLFWPFSGGLMHPKYQNMIHAIKNHPGPDYPGIISPKTTNFLIIFAFQALLLTKIDVLHFWGAQNSPPEAQGFENVWIWCQTPKFTLWPWY